MSNIPESLVAAIRSQRAILFAGAGLSCSLGLPLFDFLARHLADELKKPEARDVDFPILAEYYMLCTSRYKELIHWMEQTWHPPNIDITRSSAHNAILDLNFPVIYTTNYDSWLERSFAARSRPFRKIINVSDLAQTRPEETEIVKFHGDFEDPESIVLTESHFLHRMSLEAPLDIRLRSDSLARPILFVGYSLSDPNIRYLLYRLGQLWAAYREGRTRPNSYILMVRRDAVQEQLLRERGVEPIVWAEDDPSRGLTRFFSALCDAVGGRAREQMEPLPRTTLAGR